MKTIYDLIKNNPNLKDVNFSEKDAVSLYVYLKDIEKCSNCLGLDDCKMRTKGYMSVLNKNSLEVDYAPCKYLVKSGRLNDTYFESSMLPKKLCNASIDNFKIKENNDMYKNAYLYSLKFISSFKNGKTDLNGIFLSGSYFTGKSYLLACIANELKNKHVKTKYLAFPDFVRDIKFSIDKGDFSYKVDEIKNVDVLIIDDFGMENLTDWLRDEVVGPVINYRYLNELPTLYASNLDYNQLIGHFSLGKDNHKAAKIVLTIKQSCEFFKFS